MYNLICIKYIPIYICNLHYIIFYITFINYIINSLYKINKCMRVCVIVSYYTYLKYDLWQR